MLRLGLRKHHKSIINVRRQFGGIGSGEQVVSEIDKYYEHKKHEERLYKWWETSGFFAPKEESGKPNFCIPMPPPNVTGHLHMGHALFIALQDVMIRYRRMKGDNTLWLPGTDHAGIATQLVVENTLRSADPPLPSREEMGRDVFLDHVWKWKQEKGDYISQQMKSLGASADWSRGRFTLEPRMNMAVTEAFSRLDEKGLLYRGEYMVQWSTRLKTALSDLEVDHVEEMGKLYTLRYKVAGKDAYLHVSTTRPETILGDLAVCVHPDDPRYVTYIGQYVELPVSIKSNETGAAVAPRLIPGVFLIVR